MLAVETLTVMQGRLLAAGRIRLDSWLEGEIVCSRLEIGPDGYVLGNVYAREVMIEGQIVGTVTGGMVHLMEGAFVEGDIFHNVLSLHATATLSGKAVRSHTLALPGDLLTLEAKAAAESRARWNQPPDPKDWRWPRHATIRDITP